MQTKPKPRFYRGILLSPYSGRAPYGWKWEALTPNGFVYADTLDGAKTLIRQSLDPKQ